MYISSGDAIPSGLLTKIVPSLFLFLRVKHPQIFIIIGDPHRSVLCVRDRYPVQNKWMQNTNVTLNEGILGLLNAGL